MLIRKLLVFTAVMVLIASPTVFAGMYDLTTAGSWANINGAIFQQFCGIIPYDPFLKIQKLGAEEGSNGSGSWPDVKLAEPLLLSEIPTVTTGFGDYREFLLEINESAGTKSRLSLDQLNIFTDSKYIYKLNEGSTYDNWIALDDSLSPVKGNGDILVYLPNSLFDDIADTANIFLYSHFGGIGSFGTYSYLSDDGREIWAVGVDGPIGPGPVPIPATVWIFGTGLVGLIGIRRKLQHN